MADVDPSDIIRVVLRQTLNAASEIDNVVHWQYTGAAGITNAEALIDAADWWNDILDELEAKQTIGLTYDEIYCYNETKAAPVGTVDVAGHANGSENANAVLPAQTAGGGYGLTNVSRVIGKKFFGGFTESANDPGGIMGAALMASLAAALAKIWDPSITYNLHDYKGGVYRALSKTLIPVATAVVNNLFYTQRRRRRGVGA